MTIQDILETLISSREIEINPVNPADIVSPFDSSSAIKLLRKHITAGNKIAVYGDYDVDGICATAIVWETIYESYKNVFPHIPHRESEGYGLSTLGIDHCLAQGAKLIVAVDNGIVAHEQIKYCRSKNCDIIIIDHHEPDKRLPDANVILYSKMCCAAGLSWFFCRDYLKKPNLEHLTLAAIATICDMMPLTGVSRSIAKYGLEQLNRTRRPGILALLKIAGVENKKVGTYEVGFMLGPRINSMGRLEHAIDSLRLLCTKNPVRAAELANVLNDTNKLRQTETDASILHAKENVIQNNIILAADVSYHPGVIGLIAAKLVEAFSRPAIAISIGEEISKGSGRSLPGFHITDFLRKHKNLFTNLGGHAAACGFTIATNKLDDLAKVLQTAIVDPKLLVKKKRVDLEIPLELATLDLWTALQVLEPFGLGNPTPIFQSSAKILETHWVGQTKKHLAIKFANDLEGIWFNAPPSNLLPNTSILATYSLDHDTWNGREKLKLMVKALS